MSLSEEYCVVSRLGACQCDLKYDSAYTASVDEEYIVVFICSSMTGQEDR